MIPLHRLVNLWGDSPHVGVFGVAKDLAPDPIISREVPRMALVAGQGEVRSLVIRELGMRRANASKTERRRLNLSVARKDGTSLGSAALTGCTRESGRYSTTAPALRNASSTVSFSQGQLTKSSCRAPALRAIAFHPFCVGTVTRTRTLPLASRTRSLRRPRASSRWPSSRWRSTGCTCPLRR